MDEKKVPSVESLMRDIESLAKDCLRPKAIDIGGSFSNLEHHLQLASLRFNMAMIGTRCDYYREVVRPELVRSCNPFIRAYDKYFDEYSRIVQSHLPSYSIVLQPPKSEERWLLTRGIS